MPAAPRFRYRFSSIGTDGVTPPPVEQPPATGVIEQPPAEQQPSDTARLQAELDRWKAQARQNETRAKENAAAATKLSEIEEAQKSTEERLTGKVGKLEGDLKTASDEIARLTAAIEHGLGKDDLILLPRGLGADEVSAAAKRLADRGGPSQQQQPPDFDGGPRSKAPGSDWDTQMRDAMRNRRR